MKQFSLEEYIKNPSRKVVTRDGRKVRIVCTDLNSSYPIVALITIYDDNSEEVVTCTQNGEYFGRNSTSKFDLFFAPENHEGWINVFNNHCSGRVGACIFKSKEDAEDVGEICSDYITTVKIEWEE